MCSDIRAEPVCKKLMVLWGPVQTGVHYCFTSERVFFTAADIFSLESSHVLSEKASMHIFLHKNVIVILPKLIILVVFYFKMFILTDEFSFFHATLNFVLIECKMFVHTLH